MYSATAATGSSIGLILGGILTSEASWPWVQYVNVPIGLAVVILTPLYVREPERHPGRVDVAGMVTATLGMGSLVFVFTWIPTGGWSDSLTPALFALAVVMLGTFLLIESKAGQPIVPLHLFQGPEPGRRLPQHPVVHGDAPRPVLLPHPVHPERPRLQRLADGLAFLPTTLGMFLVTFSGTASRNAEGDAVGDTAAHKARYVLTEGVQGAFTGVVFFVGCALLVALLVVKDKRPSAQS